MKTRLVSSLALVGALALGSAGCSLVAPVATDKVYAPSDGINADVDSIDVRNMLIVTSGDGEPFNVVFTTVNTTDSDQPLTLSFEGDKSATVSVEVPSGTTKFGHPEDDAELVTADLGNQRVGSTVTTYLESTGGQSVKTEVPILDGELDEYQAYVLSQSDIEAQEAEEPEQVGSL